MRWYIFIFFFQTHTHSRSAVRKTVWLPSSNSRSGPGKLSLISEYTLISTLSPSNLEKKKSIYKSNHFCSLPSRVISRSPAPLPCRQPDSFVWSWFCSKSSFLRAGTQTWGGSDFRHASGERSAALTPRNGLPLYWRAFLAGSSPCGGTGFLFKCEPTALSYGRSAHNGFKHSRLLETERLVFCHVSDRIWFILIVFEGLWRESTDPSVSIFPFSQHGQCCDCVYRIQDAAERM